MEIHPPKKLAPLSFHREHKGGADVLNIIALCPKERIPMCDYSLENVVSRAAMVGDRLVTTDFANSITRGFAAVENPQMAVCLRPGTEIAFDREVEYDGVLPFLRNRKAGAKLARFRQIRHDIPGHRDALEFPDGKTVLLTKLAKGQYARVLQLPALAEKTSVPEGAKVASPVR
jgi:hypothetical protein